MLNAKIQHTDLTLEIDKNKEGDFLVNQQILDFDFLEITSETFHVISENKSYNIEVSEINHEEKVFTLIVNGKQVQVALQDKYDLLLKKLGMDMGVTAKLSELKAPMPGMVLDILVKPGDEVKKGDGLLILEAMKMENVIKSPADLTIKKIEVEKAKAVEKNQVMISFE
jgi:biotin carboxyl carrier protein